MKILNTIAILFVALFGYTQMAGATAAPLPIIHSSSSSALNEIDIFADNMGSASKGGMADAGMATQTSSVTPFGIWIAGETHNLSGPFVADFDGNEAAIALETQISPNVLVGLGLSHQSYSRQSESFTVKSVAPYLSFNGPNGFGLDAMVVVGDLDGYWTAPLLFDRESYYVKLRAGKFDLGGFQAVPFISYSDSEIGNSSVYAAEIQRLLVGADVKLSTGSWDTFLKLAYSDLSGREVTPGILTYEETGPLVKLGTYGQLGNGTLKLEMGYERHLRDVRDLSLSASFGFPF